MVARYLHGLHDEGGELLHGDRPGWTLISEEVGLNPHAPGRDYTHISNRGIGVIVRLNHAYGRGGTVPTPDKYPQFAAACASWAARSKGVEWYIISNEVNHEGERPGGVVILPEQYARCFVLCRNAIKQAQPGVKVMPAAMAPYHANPTNWLLYLRTVLTLIGKSGGCDAINIHAYTRSMNPADITSRATMGGELDDQYSGFYTYRDVLTQGVPLAMTHLPAFITEFDVYGPWLDQNTGVIQAMYADVDAWNHTPGTQKILASVCFRWLTGINHVDWGMQNKPRLLDDFRAAAARGYLSPHIVPPKNDEKLTTHLPSLSTGGEPMTQLPTRDLDVRAAQRGTHILDARHLHPGQQYWHVRRLYTPDEAESDRLGPDRHILANVLINGQRQVGVPLRVTWGNGGPSERATIVTKHNPNFAFSADHPLTPGVFTIYVEDGKPSEIVSGITMGAFAPDGKWNPGAHTSTLVDFELITFQPLSSPAAGDDRISTPAPSSGPAPVEPPTQQPAANVPPLSHPIANPAQRIISQRFGENPQDYAHFGLAGHPGIDYAVPVGTPVGAVDSGVVMESGTLPDYGEYVKLRHLWGESLYAHLRARKVEAGEPVNRGTVIGLSGNTGNSTGPHLHLGVRIFPYRRGAPYDGFSDPLPYLGTANEPTQPTVPAPTNARILALIKAATKEFGLDWRFVASLAWYESNWRPDAKSPAGAMGIMQLMPATWEEWRVKVGASNPYDERDNIRVGTAYLAWLLKQVGGNEWSAAVAYNWGIGNVLQGVQPPPETVEHASRVVKSFELLEAIGP